MIEHINDIELNVVYTTADQFGNKLYMMFLTITPMQSSNNRFHCTGITKYVKDEGRFMNRNMWKWTVELTNGDLLDHPLDTTPVPEEITKIMRLYNL